MTASEKEALPGDVRAVAVAHAETKRSEGANMVRDDQKARGMLGSGRWWVPTLPGDGRDLVLGNDDAAADPGIDVYAETAEEAFWTFVQQSRMPREMASLEKFGAGYRGSSHRPDGARLQDDLRFSMSRPTKVHVPQVKRAGVPLAVLSPVSRFR
jgi:hypothetical protein